MGRCCSGWFFFVTKSGRFKPACRNKWTPLPLVATEQSTSALKTALSCAVVGVGILEEEEEEEGARRKGASVVSSSP
jgi:hypothetical protein